MASGLADQHMTELEIKPSTGAKLRVSAVIVLALGITGTLCFLLSGGGADSFTPKVRITTYMPDSTGLARNSEVRIGGIRIGRVTGVDISGYLDPQRVVRVEMKIMSGFLRSIPRDSETSIGADTLVGYKFVNIAQGKSPLLLADQGVLHSEPLKQADDRADLIRTLQNELKQADDLLIQLSDPQTKIGHFVRGDEEYTRALRGIGDLEKAMRAFVSKDSVVGNALFTNDLYEKFHAPLLQVDASLAAIQRGEGAGGKLFASDEQYNQLVKSLRDLRLALTDLNAGKGAGGTLLKDDAAYRKILKMLDSTDSLLAALNAGQGNVGALLKDPQLYQALNGSLHSMQLFLADLQANPKKYLKISRK